MTMKKEIRDLNQIAEDAVQDLREAINNYVRVFSQKTCNSENFLTIDELENMMTELDAKTRKIYLDMISDSLSGINERDLIASKKENSRGRG